MEQLVSNQNPKPMLNDQDLMRKFSELSIETETQSHQPLMTVQDANEVRHLIHGAHSKNLFLKDKFSKYWMVTTLDDTSINLKIIAKQLDAVKFTFAKPTELYEILGITPGAVSPLSLINDESSLVTIVLEKRMLEFSHQNFHPLRNDRTLSVATEDFIAFLRAINHEPIIFEVAESESIS